MASFASSSSPHGVRRGVLLCAHLIGWGLAAWMVFALIWGVRESRAYFARRHVADLAAVEVHKARVLDCMKSAPPPGLNWQQCDAIIHQEEGYQAF